MSTGQPMSRDEERILESFDYQKPSAEQTDRILAVRGHCKTTALAFMQNVEPCADRTAALRLLHEAMMTANKAIVLEGSRRMP